MKALKAMESMTRMGVDPLSVRIQQLPHTGAVTATCVRYGRVVLASGSSEGEAYERLASAVFLAALGERRQAVAS